MVFLIPGKYIRCCIAILLSGIVSLYAQTDTLHFSFPDGMGKRGDTNAYPLYLSDSLTVADSLYAGEMTIIASESVYDIIGIQTTGTLLSTVSNVQFNAGTGKLIFAHTQPLTGKGIFVEFLLKIRSNANGTDPTSLQSVLLNEGNLIAQVTDGSMRPMDIFVAPKNPPQDRVVGDTIQFTVSGDVHLPVTWSVSDTHVVAVDSTGRVIGKNSGQTTITVTDSLGLTDQTTLMPIHPVTLRSLTFSINDTTVMQNLVFLLPLRISNVSGLGITSAQFRLTYHPSILTPLSIEQSGSMTQSWALPSVFFGAGYIDVAMAGTQALQDSGMMVFVKFKVQRYANFSTNITLSNVLFNENLNASIKNATFTPIAGPVISIFGKPTSIIRNETSQLSASGGTAPYKWKMLSDTAIARIDSGTGLLQAKKSGFATYSATDVNGFDAIDSVMVHDVRLTFRDTTLQYLDTIDYPVAISDVTGLSIYSAQFVIQYDTAKIKLLSIITAGTLAENMLKETKDSAGLKAAMTGVTALTGSGTLLKVRMATKGFSSLGHIQPISFQNLLLNESGPLFRTHTQQSGNITIIDVPNIPPVFVIKLRDTTIAENQLLQRQLMATDVNGDSLTYSIFSGSAGMTMTNKGLFSWQPGFTQAGTHKVVYEVGDFQQNGVTRDSAVITVTNVNRPPQFTKAMNDTAINEGILLTVDVDAVDPDGSPVKFGLQNEFSGMKIDSVTGVFTWTPSLTQSGLYKFIIRAFDVEGGVSIDSVSISVMNVNRLPQFTKSLNDTSIDEDQLLSVDIDATDPDGDTVRYYVQNIVQGMTIDTITGNFSWKPTFTQAGTHNISFVANDRKGGFTNDPVVITVRNVNRPPHFTSTIQETIHVAVGQSIGIQFTGTDPDNDNLTFALVQAPEGAAISVNGLFSWLASATQIGIHRTIIKLSDAASSVNDTLYFKVSSTNSPPAFTSVLKDTSINEGEQFSFAYKAADFQNDTLVWSFAAVPPAGMSISSAGLVQWTPTYQQSGTYTIIVAVSDKQYTVRDTSVITVLNANRLPRFETVLKDTTIFVDSLFSFIYKGSDPDGDSLTFAFAKNPVEATITRSGAVTWVPRQVKVDTLIVVLTDGATVVYDTSVITIKGFAKLQVSSAEIDFGATVYGSLPEKSATMKNVGTMPLILKKVAGVPNEEHFASNAQAQMTLNAGQEVTITFSYTPKQIGSHIGGLVFETNDPAQPLFGFLMKGTAVSVAAVQRKVLVDLSHQPLIPLRDSVIGMTQLFAGLKRSGVDVAYAESSFTPTGYDVVFIVTPQKEFSETDRSSLRKFISEGGVAVLMSDEAGESNSAVINGILRDSLLSSGIELIHTPVSDSTNNYHGNPAAPVVTKFADDKHPFLNGVDTLVMFGTVIVTADSGAVPFARLTAPSIAVQSAGRTNAAIAVKKIGEGSIIVFGDASQWQNGERFNQHMPMNIAAKDNFAFALNVFSVDEHYELKMPEKTVSEVYQLISIPIDVTNANMAALLRANLGDINPLKWRLFGKFDPVAQRYREFPSAGFNTFARGEAYWLITRGEFALNFGNTTVLPAQDYYPFTIGPGYSMIGNPFPYAVSWKTSHKSDSVQSILWRFNSKSNDFAPESLILAPFTGYFVKNLSSDSVTISINPLPANLPKQNTVQSYAEREWRMKISAASGKSKDVENYAGVSLKAKDEFDLLDVAEPPATPTDYFILRFTNTDWKRQKGSYAVDIRTANAEGTFWEFDVTSAKAQVKVDLKFDLAGNAPNDFSFYLVDKASERLVRFDKTLAYEFTMAKNEKRRAFRFIAGNQAFIEKNSNGIPLAAVDFTLQQNYPNPFNHFTVVYYSLGHSGTVLLEVYNVLGQHVRVLKNELQQIGSYSVEWDGKDDAGQYVASGMYFYKISVINNGEKLFTHTKKMVLMK